MAMIQTIAAKLGRPCFEIFMSLSISEYPASGSDQKGLREFSEAACGESRHTDEIWVLAATESGLVVKTMAENENGRTKNVWRGGGAVEKAEELTHDISRRQIRKLVAYEKMVGFDGGAGKPNARAKADLLLWGSEIPNFDVGVLQINSRFHSHDRIFSRNIAKMLSPRLQVRYMEKKLIPSLKTICGKDWMPCFHNIKRDDLKEIYTRNLKKAEARLHSRYGHYRSVWTELAKKEREEAGLVFTKSAVGNKKTGLKKEKVQSLMSLIVSSD